MMRALLGRPSLHLEAADRVHRLRGQPDVAHDRDARGDQPADRLGDLDAALQLHGLARPSFNNRPAARMPSSTEAW